MDDLLEDISFLVDEIKRLEIQLNMGCRDFDKHMIKHKLLQVKNDLTICKTQYLLILTTNVLINNLTKK